jgi:DNA polymerase III epsilon subunit-like protein
MKQDYIFFHIETSNLNPATGEIIDMAAIRTDSEGNILVTYADRIAPLGPVDPEAQKINGYTEKDWEGAISFDRALTSMVATILEGRSSACVIVGHYTSFNQAFLKNACAKINASMPFEGRTWVDMFQLSWPLQCDELIANRSLECLANYYGIDTKNVHSAMGAIEIIYEVYWRMMKRFHLVNNAESAIRKVGTSLMDAAMGMVSSR